MLVLVVLVLYLVLNSQSPQSEDLGHLQMHRRTLGRNDGHTDYEHDYAPPVMGPSYQPEMPNEWAEAPDQFPTDIYPSEGDYQSDPDAELQGLPAGLPIN